MNFTRSLIRRSFLARAKLLQNLAISMIVFSFRHWSARCVSLCIYLCEASKLSAFSIVITVPMTQSATNVSQIVQLLSKAFFGLLLCDCIFTPISPLRPRDQERSQAPPSHSNYSSTEEISSLDFSHPCCPLSLVSLICARKETASFTR